MQVVDGIDRELANRSELSRTQISLQEANARNAELVGELDYLRRVGPAFYHSHAQWALLLWARWHVLRGCNCPCLLKLMTPWVATADAEPPAAECLQSVLTQPERSACLGAQASADQYNHLQYEREADKRKWQGEMQSRDAELQHLQSELQRLASDLGQRWASASSCVCTAHHERRVPVKPALLTSFDANLRLHLHLLLLPLSARPLSDVRLSTVSQTLERTALDWTDIPVPCRSTEVQEARDEIAAAHELEAEARNEMQELRQVTDAVRAQHRAELEALAAGRALAEQERNHARQECDVALKR